MRAVVWLMCDTANLSCSAILCRTDTFKVLRLVGLRSGRSQQQPALITTLNQVAPPGTSGLSRVAHWPRASRPLALHRQPGAMELPQGDVVVLRGRPTLLWE